MERNIIYNLDWREAAKLLPPQSIDCIITSPPYWGLRDYGHPGQLGQEDTPEDFIKNLVEGFRLLRTALKDWGTLWVNIGDSYATKTLDLLKPKDLVGVPWMLAFALRADGWYLRSDIIWHKPNTMPESVQDRPTKAHEYIFLLSKNREYYYDAEAIKEEIKKDGYKRRVTTPAKNHKNLDVPGRVVNSFHVSRANGQEWQSADGKKNKRTVWTVATRPFTGAHFACFPHELIDPCIMAGTSEFGNCKNCGRPYERQLKKVGEVTLKNGHQAKAKKIMIEQRGETSLKTSMHQTNSLPILETAGWAKTCNCETTETVPPIVYDPFMGSGTTASAAKSLGRDYLGSELNPDYMAVNEKRRRDELGLFNL